MDCKHLAHPAGRSNPRPQINGTQSIVSTDRYWAVIVWHEHLCFRGLSFSWRGVLVLTIRIRIGFSPMKGVEYGGGKNGNCDFPNLVVVPALMTVERHCLREMNAQRDWRVPPWDITEIVPTTRTWLAVLSFANWQRTEWPIRIPTNHPTVQTIGSCEHE